MLRRTGRAACAGRAGFVRVGQALTRRLTADCASIVLYIKTDVFNDVWSYKRNKRAKTA